MPQNSISLSTKPAIRFLTILTFLSSEKITAVFSKQIPRVTHHTVAQDKIEREGYTNRLRTVVRGSESNLLPVRGNRN